MAHDVRPRRRGVYRGAAAAEGCDWDDRDAVLELVRADGMLLELASERLRADPEVVLEAVRSLGDAFDFASAAMRSDREFVLQALREDPHALLFADEDLLEDKELWLEAVRQHGMMLKEAPWELQADAEVVFEACRSHPCALEYADAEFWTWAFFQGEALATNRLAGRGVAAPVYAIQDVGAVPRSPAGAGGQHANGSGTMTVKVSSMSGEVLQLTFPESATLRYRLADFVNNARRPSRR